MRVSKGLGGHEEQEESKRGRGRAGGVGGEQEGQDCPRSSQGAHRAGTGEQGQGAGQEGQGYPQEFR